MWPASPRCLGKRGGLESSHCERADADEQDDLITRCDAGVLSGSSFPKAGLVGRCGNTGLDWTGLCYWQVIWAMCSAVASSTNVIGRRQADKHVKLAGRLEQSAQP